MRHLYDLAARRVVLKPAEKLEQPRTEKARGSRNAEGDDETLDEKEGANMAKPRNEEASGTSK